MTTWIIANNIDYPGRGMQFCFWDDVEWVGRSRELDEEHDKDPN